MGCYRKPDGTVEHFQTKVVRWGDGPKKHQLRDCPECGSERVDLWYVGSSNFGGWRAICSDCGFLPDRLCKIEQEAVDLWNYDGQWKNWNPKKIWVPSKKGLGMGKVFDMANEIYGKDFYRYE